MKDLGPYITGKGNRYHLIYFETEQLGFAIGPFTGRRGTANAAAEVRADSAEEAKEELISALNEGDF